MTSGRQSLRQSCLNRPFAAGAFDLAALITTLEFVGEPGHALREAARVARSGLSLGVLNRHSLLAWRLRRSGAPLWQAARFFTLAELADLVRQAVGREADIFWRTTLESTIVLDPALTQGRHIWPSPRGHPRKTGLGLGVAFAAGSRVPGT